MALESPVQGNISKTLISIIDRGQLHTAWVKPTARKMKVSRQRAPHNLTARLAPDHLQKSNALSEDQSQVTHPEAARVDLATCCSLPLKRWRCWNLNIYKQSMLMVNANNAMQIYRVIMLVFKKITNVFNRIITRWWNVGYEIYMLDYWVWVMR